MFTFDQKFVVPSRRSICRDVLPKIVDKVESELKEVCQSSRFVALTLDLWTYRRMRCFYAITIHFINQCLFKSHLLAFKYLSGLSFKLVLKEMFLFALGSHTSDKLLKEYEALIAQYDIQDKVVRLVTDNASNNVKAFGSLIAPGFETYFKESSDELTGDEKSNGEGTTADEICCDYNTSFGNDELLRIPCFIHTL